MTTSWAFPSELYKTPQMYYYYYYYYVSTKNPLLIKLDINTDHILIIC